MPAKMKPETFTFAHRYYSPGELNLPGGKYSRINSKNKPIIN